MTLISYPTIYIIPLSFLLSANILSKKKQKFSINVFIYHFTIFFSKFDGEKKLANFEFYFYILIKEIYVYTFLCKKILKRGFLILNMTK